jgi:hypothetical protein
LRNPTVATLHHLASALGVSYIEPVTDDEAWREAAKKTKRPITARPIVTE